MEKLIKKIAPAKKIVGRCYSIQEATEWFRLNPPPDLVFSVVQLPDGLTFEFFRKLNHKVPVIFTCSFERYALDAFKANGIDYLVKPVREEELREALNKYETIFSKRDTIKGQHGVNNHPHYQERFIITVGKQMKLVPTEEIAYFYTENKLVYLVTESGEKFTTDFTLEQLEKILDPHKFFRINRQFTISISSILKMIPASKSRLKLLLKPETRYETITSFERTAKFRKWLVGLS